tara:strand:- start:2521 stop:2697 length:177 start_codon:yes stop_codon:yes gene_type:complete
MSESIIVKKDDMAILLNCAAKEMMSIPFADRAPVGSMYRDLHGVFVAYNHVVPDEDEL